MDFGWPFKRADQTLGLTKQRFDARGEDGTFSYVIDRSQPDQKKHKQLEIKILGENVVVTHGQAEHVFEDLKPVSVSANRDFLIVVGRDHVVRGVDMHLLTRVVFNAPVPVFPMKYLDQKLDLSRAVAKFISRAEWRREQELRPDRPFGEDRKKRWRVDDWVLVEDSAGGPRVLDGMSRKGMASNMKAFTTLIAYWSDLIHPRSKDKDLHTKGTTIPLPAALALSRLDRETLSQMPLQQQYLKALAEADQDEFQFEGERELPEIKKKTVFDRMADRANAAANDFPKPHLASLRARITPRALFALAAIAAGGAMLPVAAQTYGFDQQFAHAVHAVLDHWTILASPVFLDAAYARTAIKSTLEFALVVPAIWAVAALANKATGWTSNGVTAWMQSGMRFFGTLNEPFWRVLARAMSQPNLMQAWSLGLNPNRTVDPASPLGVRAGLDVPTRLGLINGDLPKDERVEISNRQRRLLRAAEDEQNERISLARWLALKVVSEESGWDVATLEAVAEDATANAILMPDDVNERRLQLSVSLARDLLRRPEEFDTRAISKVELDEELKTAREAWRRLERANWSGRAKSRFVYEWDRISRGGLRGLHEFARDANHFWRTAIPTQFIASLGFRAFVSDWYFGMLTTEFYSDRSDPVHKPKDVAAQEGRLFHASPAGLYDIGDTARWDWSNFPAILTRMFMREQSPDVKQAWAPPQKAKDGQRDETPLAEREPSLAPLQYRADRVDRVTKEFFKHLVNPSTGRYGELLQERLNLSFLMMQTSFMLTFSMRVLMAGSDPKTAIYSYIFHFIAAHIIVGQPFDWVTRSLERMRDTLTANKQKTEKQRQLLARGVRFDNQTEIDDGMNGLIDLYKSRLSSFRADFQEKIRDWDERRFEGFTTQQAIEMMEDVRLNPPLPGKLPGWLEWGSTLFSIVIGTELAIRVLSIPTFGDNPPWGLLIGGSAAAAAVLYPLNAKAVKTWRRHQRRTAKSCEHELTNAAGIISSLRPASH